MADIIAARAAIGKNYGVILIPEGLLEHVPEVGLCLFTCVHALAESRSLPARPVSWCPRAPGTGLMPTNGEHALRASALEPVLVRCSAG